MSKLQLVLQEFDTRTMTLSVDQLLAELQIAVERVSFSTSSGKPLVYSSASIAQIDMLFDGEISDEMLGYVQWLFQNQFLNVLVGDTGLLFLNECIKRYRNLVQVRIITAVPLQDSLKNHMREQLSGQYPKGSRFVFEVNSTVVAGFIIDDGTRRIDKSLQTFKTQKMKESINKVLQGDARG